MSGRPQLENEREGNNHNTGSHAATWDGLLVRNQMAPKPGKGVVSKALNNEYKRGIYELYHFDVGRGNDAKGNQQKHSNQRDITIEWQKHGMERTSAGDSVELNATNSTYFSNRATIYEQSVATQRAGNGSFESNSQNDQESCDTQAMIQRAQQRRRKLKNCYTSPILRHPPSNGQKIPVDESEERVPESNDDEDAKLFPVSEDGKYIRGTVATKTDSLDPRSTLGGSLHRLLYLSNTPTNPNDEATDTKYSSWRTLSSTTSEIGPLVDRFPSFFSKKSSVSSNNRAMSGFYKPTTDLERTKRPISIGIDKSETQNVGMLGELPKPFRLKSKKQREKERRMEEIKKAKKKSIKLKRSLRQREEYQPLSDSFPVLKEPQAVFIHCCGSTGFQREQVIVETKDRNRIASLNYTELKPNDRKLHGLVSGRRVLRDDKGNQCALILHTKTVAGKSIFKICGPAPMTSYHKAVGGFFVWAEVRNIGKMKPQFCLTIRGDASPNGGSVHFKTKALGSTFLDCWSSNPRGFSIFREIDEELIWGFGAISFFSNTRGVSLSAKLDFGLMLCFALVIDEMVAFRMR